MSAELPMTYLTPRPCSHVGAHHSARKQVVWLRLSWIVQFSSANCLTNVLKHSCIQVIASALARYLSTKVSAGCQVIASALAQNWTIATQNGMFTQHFGHAKSAAEYHKAVGALSPSARTARQDYIADLLRVCFLFKHLLKTQHVSEQQKAVTVIPKHFVNATRGTRSTSIE